MPCQDLATLGSYCRRQTSCVVALTISHVSAPHCAPSCVPPRNSRSSAPKLRRWRYVMRNADTQPAPMLVDARTAARLLAISERSLWALTAPRGPIACVRIGRAVRYDPRDL